MVSGTEYEKMVDAIISLAEKDSNIHVVLGIGSQVQEGARVDNWSDLDIMMLVDDHQSLLLDDRWLETIGEPVCGYVDTTKLGFVEWDWTVKRVLFDDYHDIDFSILPVIHLDSVLSVNKEIIFKGFRVIYDSTNLVEAKILSMIREEKTITSVLTESELNNIINDILYHVVWVEKKINRGELWIAVTTINNHINNLLLKLIEVHNQKTSEIMYDGRYLENRTDQSILDKMSYCFTKYDSDDASSTLQHILELTYTLSNKLFIDNGNQSHLKFQKIREMKDFINGTVRTGHH